MFLVILSQYFLWYLCLLPLVIPNLSLTVKQGLGLLLLWFAGQVIKLSTFKITVKYEFRYAFVNVIRFHTID